MVTTPIAPSSRYTTYNPVVATTDFPVGFPLFDNTDVALYLGGDPVAFTVTADYVDGVSLNAVCKVASPGITGFVEVVGKRTPRRTDQYANGAPLPINNHNYSLNRLTAENQEEQRDIGRSLKLAYSAPVPPAAHYFLSDGKGNVYDGGSGADIADAQENAEATRADRLLAQAALAATLAAMSSVVPNIFATKAAAQAYAPTVAPNFIYTMGLLAAGDYGGARYKKVAVQPSHAGKLSITLADGITVVWYEIAEDVIAFEMLGAVGDGVVNDQVAVQAALTVAGLLGRSAGGTPGKTYDVQLGLTVPTNTTLYLNGCTIKGKLPAGAETVVILKLNSGCRVLGDGGKLAGMSTESDSTWGVTATGTRNGVGVAPTMVSNIVVRDLEISNCGAYGIEFDFAKDVKVTNCKIKNIGYSAVFGYSAEEMWVDNCVIDTLWGETKSGELNAYGVTFTSAASTTDFVRDPRSKNSGVRNCVISNIPTWHALDTHAGDNIKFINNIIRDCRRGAILTGTSEASPTNCVVQGNDIRNTLSGLNAKGTSKQGEAIWIAGQASPKPRARNNVVKENTIYQHGGDNVLLPAIYLLEASGCTVERNTLIEPFSAGIGLEGACDDTVIRGNTIVNAKSPTSGGATANPSGILFIGSGWQDILVAKNTITKNADIAGQYVMTIGVSIPATSSKAIQLADNDVIGVVTPFYAAGNYVGLSGDWEEGFVLTMTGVTGSVTGNARALTRGGTVTVSLPSMTGTSNSNALTFTGMPAIFAASATRAMIARVVDADVAFFGIASIGTSAVIACFKGSGADVFTASGTKGIQGCDLTYLK